MLLKEAADKYNWDLNYGSIALMWRGGCIIRSVFLGQIKNAFDEDPRLSSLLIAPFFIEALCNAQEGWRDVVGTAVNLGTILIFVFSLKYIFYWYNFNTTDILKCSFI